MLRVELVGSIRLIRWRMKSDAMINVPIDVPSDVPSDLPSPRSYFTRNVACGGISGVPRNGPSDIRSNVRVPSSESLSQQSKSPSSMPSVVSSDVPSGVPSDVLSHMPSNVPSDVISFIKQEECCRKKLLI